MKKFVTIFIALAILIQSVGYLSILGAFKFNQTYITKNICINRFDVIPICFGSCFLEDQFKNANDQNQESPDFSSAMVSLFVENMQTDEHFNSYSIQQIVFSDFNSSFIPNGYIESIFHPPIV